MMEIVTDNSKVIDALKGQIANIRKSLGRFDEEGIAPTIIIEGLVRQNELLQRQNDALTEFANTVIRQYCWEGGEIDGGSLQDYAEKIGLIKLVKYDPEIHGESDCELCEPGDDYFELTVPNAVKEIEAAAVEKVIDECAWHHNREFIKIDELISYADKLRQQSNGSNGE